MSLKSPKQRHNSWGIVPTENDLPNKSGAGIQDSALEVGDIVQVASKRALYHCTTATLGAAVWARMINDSDAIHEDVAGEFAAITNKASPTVNDLVVIEDGADGWSKKKSLIQKLPTAQDANAVHDNVAAEISAVTEKTSPVAADLVLIEDVAASNAKKKAQLGNLYTPETANLWRRPATPHSEDDEFDSTTLDAGWFAYSFTTAAYRNLITGVDIYDGSYVGNDLRYAVHGVTRPSWCLLQATTNVSQFMGKSITVPTNLLIVARLKFNQYYSAATASDRVVALAMFADSAGSPSASNYVMAQMNSSVSAGVVQGRYLVTPSLDNRTTDVDAQGQALEYAAIHKIGTAYHGWFGTAAGNWIWMGSATEATALPYVGIYVYCTSSTSPGLGVLGVDFIRFYETDNFLL